MSNYTADALHAIILEFRTECHGRDAQDGRKVGPETRAVDIAWQRYIALEGILTESRINTPSAGPHSANVSLHIVTSVSLAT